MSWVRSWFKRLSSQDRRRAARRDAASEVAYYWDGGAPVAHRVRDISATGIYLYTDDRWYPGTLVTMTLQKAGNNSTDASHSIAVRSRVIRSGTDGVGFEFVLPEGQDGVLQGFSIHGREKSDKKALDRFLERRLANALNLTSNSILHIWQGGLVS